MNRLFFNYMIFFLLSGLVLAGIKPSLAAEYIIGEEDVLKISFGQAPELDQVVQVRQDGKITLSIIGEMTAAGLTPKELAQQIERSVSLYNKQISQATVTVVNFNSQKVFVTGQVSEPGKKTFEVIPDLWTIIKESGGTTDIGDLSRVTIVRSEENGGEVITVNVLEAVASGKVDQLPLIKSGDTIEVPKTPGGLPGRQLAADYSQRKNLYYILGEVVSPGGRSYENGIDIFDAVGTAGGTTGRADLSDVRIISKSSQGSTVMKVDLKKYHENGQARRILIKPEDTIVIGAKHSSILSWAFLRDFAAVTGTVVSFIYLVRRR